MEPLSAIGARVRTFRKRRGLTQEELAGRIGRSSEALSVLERGRSTPTLPVLGRLSEALAVPLRDFFAPEQAPAQSPEEAAFYAALLDSARSLRPAELGMAARILAVIAEHRGNGADGRGVHPAPALPASNPSASDQPTSNHLRETLALLLRLYNNDRRAIAATLNRRRRFLAAMGEEEDAAFLGALLKRLRRR